MAHTVSRPPLPRIGSFGHDAVAPMQMLVLYSFVSAVGIPAGTAYKAAERVDVLLKLAVPRLLLLIAALATFVDHGLVAAAGCQVWSPLYRNANPDDVAAAKALGLKTIPWTVNERADMERLIALGVDGLITDYPDRLRAVMAAREMPLPPAIK